MLNILSWSKYSLPTIAGKNAILDVSSPMYLFFVMSYKVFSIYISMRGRSSYSNGLPKADDNCDKDQERVLLSKSPLLLRHFWPLISTLICQIIKDLTSDFLMSCDPRSKREIKNEVNDVWYKRNKQNFAAGYTCFVSAWSDAFCVRVFCVSKK